MSRLVPGIACRTDKCHFSYSFIVRRKGPKPIKTAAQYLAALPKNDRVALERLHRIIKAAAPEASEVIGYHMPIYKHYGMLVGFAAFKHHCTFFVMSTNLMRKFADELKRYETTKGGILFVPEKPLPSSLVKRLVRARIAENERRRK